MSQVHSKKQINFCLGQDSDTQSTNPIDKIVSNIKNFSQQNGNLLQKYDQQFYLNYFDHNTIQQTSIKLGSSQQQNKQLKLQQFIRRFLGFIEHKDEETLFLAMSLRTLFIKIKEQTNNEVGLRFADLTNYLCDRIAKDDPDLVAPLKQVPQQKIQPDVSRIRQIDINPPLVLKNDTQSDLPRIAKTKKKKDKKLAQRKPVSQFIYNFQTNQIITIGRLASCIHFYDNQLKKQPTQITPKTYLDISRQIAILSMDFDEANQRIGVIINGMGIVFWEASDNYQTQKTISKYFGQKIFYLKLFKEWVTSDKNTLYFWNLNDQTVSKKIVNQQAVVVNDVCQINHLRCICVSYTTLNGSKSFIVYKNNKPIARYDMGSTGCHSLHYNIPSQMIIAAGYHNTMEVFQVQNKTFSINLKKQLKGHSSIVTCVSDIRNTNFILSGDDSGQIRIWQLNFMKCIQVVKVSKYINQVYCTGQKLIFSDSRLNIMQMDKFSLPYTNDDQIIYQFFDQQTCSQFAVTRKCFRRINFYTGRIQMVFVICDQDQQISSAIKISSGIIIGMSKGNLRLYTTEGREKWNVCAHEGEITAVRYDRKTRFVFCLGSDNKLTIWPQKSLLIEGPKKVITFKNKPFNLLSLLTQVRILFLASSQQPQIIVWDYQNLKLLTIIKLNSPVIFMEVNTLYRMLLISTVNDELCFFKLLWKNGRLDYEIVYYGDSVFSALKKTKTVNYSYQTGNRDGEEVNENANKGILTQSKKKKSTKKLVYKVSITPQNDNTNSQQKFITNSIMSCKQDKQLKKSRFKIKPTHSSQKLQLQPQPTNLPIPSIRIIQQQPITNALTHQTQQMLPTLKSLKKIDNQISTRIQIKNTQQSVFLVMGNSKGQITCFDITLLIKQHFSDYQTQFKQSQSPNIYRPARQDHDQQLLKQKHSLLPLQSIKKIPKTKKSYFRPVWKQCCRSRQPISCLSFIEMRHVYVSVSMTDGCCKYFELSTGVVKGELRMSLPLPIYWQVEIQKDLYIKKNIYQTLIVLDNVISNHGFQMLSKQYQAINVTKFLQSLNTKKKPLNKKPISKSTLTKLHPQVTLLNQQYSIQDVNHIIHGVTEPTNHQSTLKSLQAHKRVNLIKQQMILDQLNSDQRQQGKASLNMGPNELLRQKEQLQKLFSSNYFSVLGEHGASSKLNKSVELGSIEERSTLLLEKINQSKKNMNTNDIMPKKPISKRLKRQASLQPSLPAIQTPLIQSTLFGKEDSSKEGNLVEKLSHSLTSKATTLKPKNSSELPSALLSSALIGSILKNNTSSISVLSSKLPKMPYSRTAQGSMEKENKYERRNLPGLDRGSIIEDKSTREILSQINEKLSRYKKSNYVKRDIIQKKYLS